MLQAEVLERPEDTELRPELMMYRQAWQDLRYDRTFGAMGGEFPLPFSSIDRYAKRYGIAGRAFDILHELLYALDGVHLEIVAEKQKEEEARRKAESKH